MKRLLLLLGLLLLSVPFVFGQGVGQRGTTSVNFAPNDTTTGTTQYRLAKIVGGKVIRALTTDTAVPLYVVITATATSGDAAYVVAGPTVCEMDTTNASGVSGQPVVESPTTPGRCRVQASMPSCGWIAGILVDDATTAGTPAKLNAQPTYSCPSTGAGITSLTLVEPAEFLVAGSPLTGPGTVTVTKATQVANSVYAGPPSGGAVAPGFRALVAADLPAGTASGACGGDTGGTYPNCTVLKASGTFALTGDTTPPQLTGDLNDANLTGFATNTTIRLNGGANDRLLTGFVAGGDGDIKCLQNIGTTSALTLREQSGSSSPSNRLMLGGDVTLFSQQVQCLQYDATSARWRAFGTAMLDAYRVRSCAFSFGSMSASAAPLAADDDQPNLCKNTTGRDWVVTSVTGVANTGVVTALPVFTGGTALLTGAFTLGTGTTWLAGTLSGTPILHSFSTPGTACGTPPCSIDGNLSGVDGVATYAMIDITFLMK